MNSGSLSRPTLVAVDVSSIDVTLGTIVGGEPTRWERPLWDEMLAAVAALKPHQPCYTAFCLRLSAKKRRAQRRFARKMAEYGIAVALVNGSAEADDRCLRAVLAHAIEEGWDIVLATHDSGYARLLREARASGLTVFVTGFEEHIPSAYDSFPVLDLEEQLPGIRDVLPRIRPVTEDNFDPCSFVSTLDLSLK